MRDPSTTAAIEAQAWLGDDRRPLDWNGPVDRPFTPFAEEDLDRPIVELLGRVARRQPDRIAVSDPLMSLTYGRLWDGLSGLAEAIAAETDPGELVGVLMPASPLGLVAMLACLAAGRPFAPMDPGYPADWQAQVLEDARPALIIAGEGAGPLAARITSLTRLPAPARQGWRPTPVGPDEPACVLFTSGSTGRSKGVVNSQRALLQRVAQSINACHIGAEDRFLTLASLCTIVGVRDALTALLAGASVCLVDPQRAGARGILQVIGGEAITVLFAFPALLRQVVAASEGPGGEALRLVRVGGDTTLWSDIDQLRAWLAPGAAIQSIYAATEAPMMQWFVVDASRGDDPRAPIGYPLPGNRLAIVDEDGRATAPGEAGELVVASPYVSLGLWGQGPAGGVFRTGDLVRQRPDGLLERLGRLDRQIKIRGARVELDGVEAALRRHPSVRDVGALARTSGADGDVSLVAYVSAAAGAPAGLLDELKALMVGAAPAMRPARFYQVAEIPRLPSSKLDVRALTALDAASEQSERAASDSAPASAAGDRISQAVAGAWREVLRETVGGPDEDFFDAGGDSLKAIAFVLHLERALGLELSMTLVNEAPTFGELCQALREHRSAGDAALVTLKAGEGQPPVFIVHGAGGTVADLFPMARSMAYAGPVIGIRARGLARHEAPHKSVQGMAADYLGAIRDLQPRGPYYVCGYSFGGLVAFEMACRLRQAGEAVALLGLFDSMTSVLSWPVPVWLAFARRRTLAAPFAVWSGLYRWVASRWRPQFLESAPPVVLRVAARALMATARYRPGVYPGELTLFVPAGRDRALPPPQAIWGRHAASLCIIETAGGHLSMLAAPNAATAAAALTTLLPSPSGETAGPIARHGEGGGHPRNEHEPGKGAL